MREGKARVATKVGLPGWLLPLALDLACAAVWVLVAWAGATLWSSLRLPGIPMIFLASVIFASLMRGVRAGVVAAFAAFAAYDYDWVPPIHVVELRSAYEMMTLSLFLGLALITAVASGGSRDREHRSAVRQRMLLGFARAGGILDLPRDPAAAGERIASLINEVVGTGVYYRDGGGWEARAGDATTWWDTVQKSLPRLADEAKRHPNRTHRAGDLRARALSDGDEVMGSVVWLAPRGPGESRREIDDFAAAMVDLAAAALGRARGMRSAAA